MFGKLTMSLEPYRMKIDEFQNAQHFENRRGEMVPYATFEHVLGLQRKDVRFRSVMGPWRKHMRENHGVEFTCVANTGYRVETFVGQLRAGIRTCKRGIKQLVKADKIVEGSKPGLSPAQTKACEFTQALAADAKMRLRGAARIVLKQCDDAPTMLKE